MGVVLDSNIFIRLEREGKILDSFDQSEALFISVVTASELLHGVFRATSPKIRQNRSAFVEGLLERIPILEIDLRVARAHALLWSGLCSAGNMIGLHDSWIAATCISYGYKLKTYNKKEFIKVVGLELA
jgi:tRNA(fMet)-specific endonuclease VapC